MSQAPDMPYIKSEPDDFESLSNGYTNFNSGFGNYQPAFNGGIDPSELSMTNGNSNQGFSFGGPGMSNSFMNGGSGTIHDDELLESLNSPGDMTNMHSNGMSVPQRQMNGAYSHTPEGAPIQSPFVGGFDYNQFRPMGSISQHMSPQQGHSYMNKRPSMQAQRKSSNGQGMPMTPRTSAMASLHIGTPENGMQQNGRAIQAPRHSKSMSGQFDSTSNSLNSYLDSPLASPNNHSYHTGISERMASKHGSLPTKVDSHSAERESQEQKKKRRRASHNAVERRRRDNINDRIHDLSQLVPLHRLNDDQVKKQLASNGPMSPTVGATSMSPNAATSLLAGANGRRAASTAGNITLGFPPDEKEKGPNKGDILNGSVAWTRDLMWALYHKYQQEEELATYISSIGGTWPYEISDDDKRMRSEVMAAMEKNDSTSFSYSRFDGSGLRVPDYTNIQGDRLQSTSVSPQSNLELSPGFHSGGSGAASGNQPQFWHSAGHAGLSFKEEDELMELNS